MSLRIPVAEPQLAGREIEYVTDAVASGWVSSTGKYLPLFERAFAEAVESEHATTASNGTTALHLALAALGIGPGDEVIIPALTFIASANVVVYTGATPVFVDVDPITWTLDLAQVRAKITPRTRAVMPVHLYGHPADMTGLCALAAEYGIAVVEDACEALGARVAGRPVGAIGTIGCFSFFGNKVITTGEGGMVVTNDAALIERVELLKNHGMSPKRRYFHPIVGFNYRMTNMQAALGLAQMEQLPGFIERKRAIAARYHARLRGVPGLRLPTEEAPCTSVFWLYTMLVDPASGLDRDGLASRLAERNIETRPTFIPITDMPPYQEAGERYPVSRRIAERGISLPSGTALTDEQVDLIAGAVREAVGASQRSWAVATRPVLSPLPAPVAGLLTDGAGLLKTA